MFNDLQRPESCCTPGMGIASIIGIAGSCLQAVAGAVTSHHPPSNGTTSFDQLLKSLQEGPKTHQG
jgi:hypothetical protein